MMKLQALTKICHVFLTEFRKPEGKSPLRKPSIDWRMMFKTDLKETECECGLDACGSGQTSGSCMNMVINF
jgi:hypothetical protein